MVHWMNLNRWERLESWFWHRGPPDRQRSPSTRCPGTRWRRARRSRGRRPSRTWWTCRRSSIKMVFLSIYPSFCTLSSHSWWLGSLFSTGFCCFFCMTSFHFTSVKGRLIIVTNTQKISLFKNFALSLYMEWKNDFSPFYFNDPFSSGLNRKGWFKQDDDDLHQQ